MSHFHLRLPYMFGRLDLHHTDIISLRQTDQKDSKNKWNWKQAILTYPKAKLHQNTEDFSILVHDHIDLTWYFPTGKKTS